MRHGCLSLIIIVENGLIQNGSWARHGYRDSLRMQHNKDTKYVDGILLSGRDFNVIYDCLFREPVRLSERKYKRDFMVEHKHSFEIKGIDFHSWRNDLYAMLNTLGANYYDGMSLDLKPEPWNQYDENAIAIYLLGRKLGYVARCDTEEVSNIMLFSKHYSASFKHECIGYEMCEITYLREFHDTSTLPYQANVILKSSSINTDYDEYTKFIKACVGHTIEFDISFLIDYEAPDDDYYEQEFYLTDEQESFLNNYISVKTDMQSTIGFIDNTFIRRQYRKTPMAGFVEDVVIDDQQEQVEIRLRMIMEKSVVNKNYLKSYTALENYFASFGDVGSYSISLADLVKIVPRKSRSISAYEPLVKYLKEYHAITLNIME